MLVKCIIVFFLIIILYSLGSGLYFLMKNEKSDRMVKALSWRIGLSLLLFFLLFMGFASGLIVPHSISGMS